MCSAPPARRRDGAGPISARNCVALGRSSLPACAASTLPPRSPTSSCGRPDTRARCSSAVHERLVLDSEEEQTRVCREEGRYGVVGRRGRYTRGLLRRRSGGYLPAGLYLRRACRQAGESRRWPGSPTVNTPLPASSFCPSPAEATRPPPGREAQSPVCSALDLSYQPPWLLASTSFYQAFFGLRRDAAPLQRADERLPVRDLVRRPVQPGHRQAGKRREAAASSTVA
jgi:hypothetical protein